MEVAAMRSIGTMTARTPLWKDVAESKKKTNSKPYTAPEPEPQFVEQSSLRLFFDLIMEGF
jgi:chorismate mutase